MGRSTVLPVMSGVELDVYIITQLVTLLEGRYSARVPFKKIWSITKIFTYDRRQVLLQVDTVRRISQ